MLCKGGKMSKVYFHGDKDLPTIGAYCGPEKTRMIQLTSNKDDNILHFPLKRLPKFITELLKTLKEEQK